MEGILAKFLWGYPFLKYNLLDSVFLPVKFFLQFYML